MINGIYSELVREPSMTNVIYAEFVKEKNSKVCIPYKTDSFVCYCLNLKFFLGF